jgi:hypothetical protein
MKTRLLANYFTIFLTLFGSKEALSEPNKLSDSAVVTADRKFNTVTISKSF